MSSPTTVLTQSLYPAGTHYSSGLAWQSGTLNVAAAGLLADADALSAANQAQFSVEVSFDGGKTYTFATGYGWVGGTNPKTAGPNLPSIGLGYTASQQVPTHARVRVDLPATLSIGAALSFS